MADATASKQPAYALELAKLLNAAGSSSFACSGALNSSNHPAPLLEIDGLGELALPLTPDTAEALKSVCEQAPFGRGTSTVVDTSVRSTWQLGTDKFKIALSSSWLKTLSELLDGVCQGLGMTDCTRVDAQLYKLLLYEKGSFFAPHKDTEKVPGMFGTLVVHLPSEFKGGDLVVRHNGQEHTYGTRQLGPGAAGLSYVAFYADCEHEVKPVTKGYRLCLTYNLRLAGGPRSCTAPAGAPAIVSHLARLCEQWEADPDGPTFLVYMLEHRYTQQGRWGLSSLKGNDITRAHLLQQLSQETGAGVALVRARCHASGNGGEDSESWDSAEWDIDDITYSVDHWCMLGGQAVQGMGRTIIQQEDMLPEDVFVKLRPDREEAEGPTGNEGAPVDRWYHHAAIVLWPASHRCAVMATSRGGPAIVMAELGTHTAELARQHGSHAKSARTTSQSARQQQPQPQQQQQQQQQVVLPPEAEADLQALCKAALAALAPNRPYSRTTYAYTEAHESSESSGAGAVPRGKKPSPVLLQHTLPALQGLVQLGRQQEAGELMVAAAKARQMPADILQLLPFLKQQFVPAFGWAAAAPWLQQLVLLDLGRIGRQPGLGFAYGGSCCDDSEDYESNGYEDEKLFEERLPYDLRQELFGRLEAWGKPVVRLLLGMLDVQPLQLGTPPVAAAAAGGGSTAAAAGTGSSRGGRARTKGASAAAAAAAGAPELTSCFDQVKHVTACPEAQAAVAAAAKLLLTAAGKSPSYGYTDSAVSNAARLATAFQLLTVLGLNNELQQLLRGLHIKAGFMGSPAAAAGSRQSGRIKSKGEGAAAAAGRGAAAAAAAAGGSGGTPSAARSAAAEYQAAKVLAPAALSVGAWLAPELCQQQQQQGSDDPEVAARVEASCKAAAASYRALVEFCCSGLGHKVSPGPPDIHKVWVLPTDGIHCTGYNSWPSYGSSRDKKKGDQCCRYCTEAKQFLADGNRTRWELVENKDIRGHVEWQLRTVPGVQIVGQAARCRVLVMEKTDEHYKAQVSEYLAAQDLINTLKQQSGAMLAAADGGGAQVEEGQGTAAGGDVGNAQASGGMGAAAAAAAAGGGGGGKGVKRGRGRPKKQPAASSDAAAAPAAGVKKQRAQRTTAAAAPGAAAGPGVVGAATDGAVGGGTSSRMDKWPFSILTGRKRPAPSSAEASAKKQHPPRCMTAAAAGQPTEGEDAQEQQQQHGPTVGVGEGPLGGWALQPRLLRNRHQSVAPTHFIKVLGSKLWGGST